MLLALLLLWSFIVAGNQAKAAECDLTPRLDASANVDFTGAPLRQLAPAMRYFSDTDGNLDLKSALQRFRRGEVSKLNGSEQFSLPYSTSIYWVAFNITNQQDVPAFLHPTANQPFFRLLEFYVIRPDCSVQLVLDHQQATPYRAEEFYGPNLTGRPFRIDAAETVTFVLRYGSYGFTFLPLSLETPQSIERVANAAETRVAIFYTLALTALIFFLGLNIAIAGAESFSLALTLSAALVLLAQIDGLLFAHVWPDAPVWNSNASFFILTAVSVLALLTARRLARRRLSPLFRRLFLAAIAVCLLPMAFLPVYSTATLTLFSLLLAPLAIASMAYAIVIWAKGVRLQNELAYFAAGFIGLLMLGLTISMLLGNASINFVNHDLAKLTYLIIATGLMIAFSTRARALNLDYRASLERELDTARREAEKSRLLLETERAFNRTRELAERRRAQLAEASHDLRQPLASLRFALDSFAGSGKSEAQNTVHSALQYAEDLLLNYLEDSRPEAPGAEANPATPDEAGTGGIETFRINLILDTLAAVFTREASAKGLSLRIVPNSLPVTGAPTPLLRIASNLTKNAVKYTAEGKVLIGIKRQGTAVELVIADTGPGMSEDEQATFARSYEKSQSSDGHGLGLAIAYQLAQENGYRIDVSSARGGGTCFRIAIPLAASENGASTP